MAARPRSRRLARSRRTLPDVPGQNQPGPMIRAAHRAISHPRPMPARCRYLRARHPDRGPGSLDLPAARRPRRSHLAEREFPDLLGIPRRDHGHRLAPGQRTRPGPPEIWLDADGDHVAIDTLASGGSTRRGLKGALQKAIGCKPREYISHHRDRRIGDRILFQEAGQLADRFVLRITGQGPRCSQPGWNLRSGSGRFSVRSERRSAHKAAQMRQSSPDVAF